MFYHPEQLRLWESPVRFRTVPAGRRSGKTELAKRKLVLAAINRRQNFPDARYFASAPTRDQAKRIFWEDLKRMVPNYLTARKPSETDMTIHMVHGPVITVLGMDVPERIEGVGWDGGIVDEFGNIKETAWLQNIRPALSDRKGWAWLIGVPEGRNHYYIADKNAQADTTGEWDSFHWKSADILPPEEIAAAKRDLDELTYLQEYEASFIYFEGRAYYPFEDRVHARFSLPYVPAWPLVFCFDFNVAPGVAVVCQELPRPDEAGLPIVGDYMTGCIGEVFIPTNSNTPMVCRRLIQDWGDHEGEVWCYGDATGGAKGSAKVLGSDWELIRQILGKHFGDRLRFRVPRDNPRERDRVNAVNSRLKAMDGTVRMMVDPGKCPELVRDLEGVVLVKGGSGEIDKKKDPARTHLTDGLGYYIAKEFPTRKVEGGMTSVEGL